MSHHDSSIAAFEQIQTALKAAGKIEFPPADTAPEVVHALQKLAWDNVVKAQFLLSMVNAHPQARKFPPCPVAAMLDGSAVCP